MGKGKKKKKTKSLLRTSSLSVNTEFTSFQDEVIQHLQLFKESSGLVVGFNAVIRSLEKNSLSLVLYISRRGFPAMFHALNMMCKGKDIIFLQLPDINTNVFDLKIPSSTTYGIKKCVLDQPQFSKLLEKVNIAKKSHKNRKEKTAEEISVQSSAEDQNSQNDLKTEILFEKNKEMNAENQRLFKDTMTEIPYGKSDVNSFIHVKHDVSKQKHIGNNGMLNFQEIDFPNYKTKYTNVDISVR